MSIKIFTLTHKEFDVPRDPMYQPLQVGHARAKDLGYWCDDTGDHISDMNCYYSELTGFYWIYKNYHKDDYIGTCHYRRYLINQQEKIFTQEEYEALFNQYDLITTLRVCLNNSYHYGFAANHNVKALDMTGEVIKEIYPEYYENFDRLVHANETYFGNMIVTSHALFDEYCEWLFTIFAEVQKRVKLDTDEDDYHKRVFGFISEFLLLVWTTTKELKVCECKVGMLGEKAETREVKEELASYFAQKDMEGAKKYFKDVLKKRPDVLMEASDITGELKLSMQVIATVEQEYKVGTCCVLDRKRRFQELMQEFSTLNKIVTHYQNANQTEQDVRYLVENKVSSTEIHVAVVILKTTEEEKKTIYKKIMKDIDSAK